MDPQRDGTFFDTFVGSYEVAVLFVAIPPDVCVGQLEIESYTGSVLVLPPKVRWCLL